MNESDFSSIEIKYFNAIDNFLAKQNLKIQPHKLGIEKDHIRQICASIMMTRDKILNGGSFVKAIVSNDLQRAVSYADSICIKHLKLFVEVKTWCFVE